MSFVDLIIIYLACGAPFGVFQFTTTRTVASAHYALLVASTFLLWPVFALILIVGWFRSSAERESTERRSRIEKLRMAIEEIIFTGDERLAPVFEFREVFYRYYGLLDAAELFSRSQYPREIFNATSHPNPRLAARCLARRNFSRLKTHENRARTEMLDLLSSLTTNENRSELTSLITNLGHDWAKNLQPLSLGDEVETFNENHNSLRKRSVDQSAA